MQEDAYVITEINKTQRISFANRDEDHLEEPATNKTEEPLATEKVSGEASAYVGIMDG